jgi:hypothetical protein
MLKDKYINKKRILFEGKPEHFEKFVEIKELS